MKKATPKKLTAKQKKVAQVMHEFKEGELHSGKTDVIVTNPKQAIAIALSEAEEIDKSKKIIHKTMIFFNSKPMNFKTFA